MPYTVAFQLNRYVCNKLYAVMYTHATQLPQIVN